MKGRDILKGLSEEPTSSKEMSAQTHRPAGAVRAMSLNLNRLSDEAAEGRALRETLSSGQAVIELDPNLIEKSFVRDRIQEQSDPAFLELKGSILQNGQQVPILVRPSPNKPGDYQAAYGHRRLRAAIELGLPVKAIVRQLSDEQLILAQAQENGGRVDLSFIERALFAKRLEDHGFSRDVISASLSVDKPELSRLLQVAQTVSQDLIVAIGPAHKVGRPRWLALAEKLRVPRAHKIALSQIAEPSFPMLETNKRFERIWAAVSPRPESEHQSVRTRSGQLLASLESGKKGLKISVSSARFASFLAERLPDLVSEFESKSDETQ